MAARCGGNLVEVELDSFDPEVHDSDLSTAMTVRMNRIGVRNRQFRRQHVDFDLVEVDTGAFIDSDQGGWVCRANGRSFCG